MTSHSIAIFTDGSARGNPGPGGFGAIIIAPKNSEYGTEKYEVKELGGRETRTTNNRMELQAAISALSSIPDSPFSIRLCTDSSYLINGITKWIFGWQKNGWKTRAKKDVLNRDLWEKLAELMTMYRHCEWRMVGGHAGVAGNARADEIATAFADNRPPKLYSGVLKHYRIPGIADIKEDTILSEKKKSVKARSAAKPHSYVSFVDGAVQTHKTWAECERRVKGAPGARFRKVFSPEEERRLVFEWGTIR